MFLSHYMNFNGDMLTLRVLIDVGERLVWVLI